MKPQSKTSKLIKRVEFTDAQKATIYARDRATCCFSGANLWLLEAPLRPGYQRDWVDHVLPSARGGTTDIDNGVCASHTFNAKKRHNTADHSYLFEAGLPTTMFREIFGSLSGEQEARLRRFSNLREADWYFNRALGQILLGFDYRCRLKRYGEKPARDDHYWFGVAYRKIVQFQKLNTETSLEQRGIVTAPSQFALSWLSLRHVANERDFLAVVNEVYPHYRINHDAWMAYFYDDDLGSPAQRKRALHKVEKTKGLSEDTLQCIVEDYALRSQKHG